MTAKQDMALQGVRARFEEGHQEKVGACMVFVGLLSTKALLPKLTSIVMPLCLQMQYLEPGNMSYGAITSPVTSGLETQSDPENGGKKLRMGMWALPAKNLTH